MCLTQHAAFRDEATTCVVEKKDKQGLRERLYFHPIPDAVYSNNIDGRVGG